MMTTKILYIKRRLTCALALMILSQMSASYCFAQTDSTSTDDIVNQEPRAISSYGGKNVIEEYTLQSPMVSKRFDNKKFLDHAFVEGGMGANSMMGRWVDGYFTKVSPSIFGSVGDWVTPEHGWRATAGIGYFNHPVQSRAKFLSVELDYLMNLTALSKWEYPTNNRFEVMGVAGFNFFKSHQDGRNENGFGANLGLRGLYHLSSYTYFFLEPKATLNYKMLHANDWYKIRPSVSLSAGFGFNSPRIAPHSDMYKNNSEVYGLEEWPTQQYDSDGHFLNDTYVTLLGGPSVIANFHRHTLKKYIGSRFKFAVGKMFNPYIGAQLSLNGGINRVQNLEWHAKTYGVGAEAVWNMHNTFGGYKSDRFFTVNALAGLAYNVDMYGTSTKQQNYSWSFGGGLQAKFRLANGVDFVAEPRIDVYDNKFVPVAYSMAKYDVITSALFGFNFHQGMNTRSQVERNRDYSQESWYDDLFAQLGGGLDVPFSFAAGHEYKKSFKPQGFMAIGKWFSATDGVRAWISMGNIWQNSDVRTKFSTYGLDYMWNATNALHGYKADRKFYLYGGIGLNIMGLRDRSSSYLGAQLSAQGVYKINNLYGLFIEPQARFYDKNALKYTDCFPKNSILLNLVAGVQVSMKGYKPNYYSDFADEEGRSFLSVGVGATTPIRLLKHVHGYGPTMKIAYGKWYSPISAWRIGGWGYINKVFGARYGIVNASIDYLMDASAFAFGYNPDRIVTTRVVAGVDLGMDYQKDNVRFVPQVHFGGQLAVKVSPNMEIFAEPQYIYSFSNRFDSRLLKTSLQGLMGVNYLFGNGGLKRDLAVGPKRHFVSAGFGAGVNSAKIDDSSYKLKLGGSLGYGYWFNGMSGVRASWSVNGTNTSKYDLHQLHLDYLLNMVTALSGRNTQDDKVQVRGIVGVNVALLYSTKHRARHGFGIDLGTQVAYSVAKDLELYIEPSAQLFNKNVFDYHVFEGLLDAKVGLNYKF